MNQYIINNSLLNNDSIDTDNEQAFFLYTLKTDKRHKKSLSTTAKTFSLF
jgi:hypothetical protein